MAIRLPGGRRGPVHQIDAHGDEQKCGKEMRRQRIVQERCPEGDAEERGQEGEGSEQRHRIVSDQREPGEIGDRRDPDRLIEEGRHDGDRHSRRDILAKHSESAKPSSAETPS